MASKVLRPHDVLMAQQMRHIPAILPAAKPKRKTKPKPSRNSTSRRLEARKRQEGFAKRVPAAGQVTILKRGEPLDAFRKPEAAAGYAGSAFSVSSSMNSLPLPSFSVKKEVPAIVAYATQDLRHLLRLE